MKKEIKPYILLLPAAIVLLGILTSGIVIALSQSLGYMPIIGLRELTIKYYVSIITDKGFLESLKFSLNISLFSSTIAVMVGVVLAYSMLINKHRKSIEKILYILPIIVPHMVAAFLMFNILSQSGLLPRILYHLGILKAQSDFPILIFDRYGVGIIISYLWKEIPFVAMIVYTFISNINKNLEEVALNLGASRGQFFWHVMLPLSWPSIISSFIIIFAFSFGAFEVPYLLGPTTPKALPVKAFIEYTNPDISNRPYAMALNVVLAFISLIIVWIYDKTLSLFCRNV
ncbi:ABC transporter permease subunit [Clostridium tagluense]|uniref:ABC transporter permease n=1 Tax=Clostridium tagluense TaxID=360422 RepID=UPI001C0CF2ED|nr:ABC transporter permease subunit [Clostridium tagluense]MBU3129899.1 ABC transporter permease subunit [Clostridium tagluense]MCB2313537.1 ABC transporter permease subunit [Clostridium tagluense]MCB2318407.1 ABC transporter permease subunit [Clostridium tagluense]MCB2323208.1 ABC transporter permease subunit [Clostridium tagluense]MCB2328145.1 ABC transporter permease subunit [Clostridium tagluense]